MSGLKRRSLRAGVFSLVDIGINYVMRFASNLILTRLLLPEAFGLMAMVSTLHVALVLFTDIGIRQSIIRDEKGDDPHYLSAAWRVQVLRGAAIGTCVFVAGVILYGIGDLTPPESVYADPTLPYLIMLSGIVPMLQGAQSTNVWAAERKMLLGRVLVYNILAQILNTLVTIGLAVLFGSVWALLLGLLAGQTLRMILSHVIIPGPRMSWVRDAEITRELWLFGRWLLISSGISFFVLNADRLVLGGVLDKTIFGYYVIAYFWIEASVAIYRRLISQIGLPALSEIVRTRPHQLKGPYFRFSRAIDGLAVLCGLIVYFAIPPLILWLYPGDYAVASAMVPFLAVMVPAQRFSLPSTLLLAGGQSSQMMIFSALQALGLVCFMVLGFELGGLNGALTGIALSPLTPAPFLIWKTWSYLGRGILLDVAWLIALPLVAALVWIIQT